MIMNESKFSDSPVVRRHRPNYLIVLYMGLLMLLGLVVIYSIGPQRANVLNNAYGSEYSETYFFFKQTISLILALVAFGFMAVIPYNSIIKYSSKLVVFALALCVILALASLLNLPIAQETGGATRWFNLGFFGSLQPAEILKFSMLVYLAGFLGMKYNKGKINDTKDTLLSLGIIMAVALFFIVVVQRDLGTGISLTGIVMAMLFIADINWKNIALILASVFVVGLLFIVSEPHRIDRVFTFLQGDNTSETSDTSSYQIEHAKMAIGAGGLFGLGIGNSVQATGYLPEAINDSVFAIIGETFGFVGLITILALFVAILMELLKIMDHLIDIRLKLLVAGVFGWFASHVILNIGSMIGVIPLTGITLPLLSFGGTSMLFITAALGLVFQLSQYTVHSSRLKEVSYENSGSRRRFGRSRDTSRGSIKRD